MKREREAKGEFKDFGLNDKLGVIIYLDGEYYWRSGFGGKVMLSQRCLLDIQLEMSSRLLNIGVSGRILG